MRQNCNNKIGYTKQSFAYLKGIKFWAINDSHSLSKQEPLGQLSICALLVILYLHTPYLRVYRSTKLAPFRDIVILDRKVMREWSEEINNKFPTTKTQI